MDHSDDFEHDDTLRGLEKAQKTLEDVESKMKKFKSRKREQSQPSAVKAPFPDLSKYFSHLTNEFNNEETEEMLLPRDTKSRIPSRDNILTDTFIGIPRHDDKENYSLTINEKLEREKNSSINKIEEYYIERNQILEEKIRELKMIKDKIVRDQKLLVRNNEELEEQLHRQRTAKEEQPRCDDLRAKIQKMREKIANAEAENGRIATRKKDLEKHIKQVVKLHKESLTHQMLTRPKSTSAVRCQYH